MTDGGQNTSVKPRFPLLVLVRASYRFVFENKAFLPLVLFQPALLYLILSFFIDVGGFEFSDEVQTGASGRDTVGFSVNGVALTLVVFVPASLLFVSWHRLILLAGSEGQPRWLYPPRTRHWKYFGYMTGGLLAGLVSVAFTIIAASIVLAVLASLLGAIALLFHYLFLVMLPAAYVVLFARLSFLFPAIAVDEPYSIADSWHQTTHITWPLAIGFLLCFLPGGLLLLAMNMILSDFIRGYGGVPLWLEAANLFVLSYSSLVSVTFITFVFQGQSGWVQARSGSESS
ncbi:hypothetical protein [Denitrobaculum tricleocarpae]|uniref:Uncharacterized protein n=1 Tax=Denitrobaculum tricleocarpae TaxID=2591009 RepID=A0A545TG62_9PROT|nr:hypothetical protein [Denitrobaculum tricleocarpae]TQV76203.1 hypothetical protein FKG95_21435 [Denitrobaculum tricleocarpae]